MSRNIYKEGSILYGCFHSIDSKKIYFHRSVEWFKSFTLQYVLNISVI